MARVGSHRKTAFHHLKLFGDRCGLRNARLDRQYQHWQQDTIFLAQDCQHSADRQPAEHPRVACGRPFWDSLLPWR